MGGCEVGRKEEEESKKHNAQRFFPPAAFLFFLCVWASFLFMPFLCAGCVGWCVVG